MREVNPIRAELFKPFYKLLETPPTYFLQINSKPEELQKRVCSAREDSQKASYAKITQEVTGSCKSLEIKLNRIYRLLEEKADLIT